MRTPCCLLCAAVWVCAVATLPATADTGGIAVERVLPFADDNSVHVVVQVKSPRAETMRGVELTGRIVRWRGADVLWRGSLGRFDIGPGAHTLDGRVVSGLKPALWSPTEPNLYNLTVEARLGKRVLHTRTVRFGFRSFTARNGVFLLNGKPIFLRGNSINPPGRGMAQEVGRSRGFAQAYVRLMKRCNVNLIRLGADSDVWLDVCDEVGMMVFQGRYGAPPGGTRKKPPSDFDAAISRYKEKFTPWVRHPSVVMYILSNEMPSRGDVGEAYTVWLRRAYVTLRRWDPTRLFIGNAGFGQGRAGDIFDMHPYWGWYGGDFTTCLRLRTDTRGGSQPWTLSECVGAYTTDTGAFNVRSKLLAASLAAAGHAADQSQTALHYQAFLVKQFVELFRRMRPLNPKLAGIMPLTNIFYNWNGARSFEALKPKPALKQLAVSFQPVLLSWEMWTPNVYAGSRLRAIAHVLNDSDERKPLANANLMYTLRRLDGRALVNGRAPALSVPYYATRSVAVSIEIPERLPASDYELFGRIVTPEGRELAHNREPLFIASKDWARVGRGIALAVYDPRCRTADALEELGFRVERVQGVATIRPNVPLVIGEDAWSGRLDTAALKRFVRAGGRLLCLRQNSKMFRPDWLPVGLERRAAKVMRVSPERPWHPVFDGIGSERLAWWSDCTGWDQTKPGYPEVHPVVLGFRLTSPDALARTAVLATCGRGLAAVALCQVFDGRGSVLLSGFDLVSRHGLDPVADRLLANLAEYMASRDGHDVHPLVDSPIRWGDYRTERGLVVGPINGLLVNAQRRGKTRDYVPQGRRPFGPFSYDRLGYVRDLRPDSKTGRGVFWARVPQGRQTMLTTVVNPTQETAELRIGINDSAPSTTRIPPQETVTIESRIPRSATTWRVQYEGNKCLILLQTAFR